MEIRKVAVLGSGVMGSGIAAHFANAGIPVLLLDIVPNGAENRNQLTENAYERMLKAAPSPFANPKCAKLLTCGNLEDDLEKLADVDWIVEAVLEDLTVKHKVYRQIDAVRKAGSVVSSNTSTLPLHVLTEGQSEAFQKDFLIAHFFNPPRFMRLLELAGGAKTDPNKLKQIEKFADEKLGKGVVHCKDTPGFLANRIGIFWMMAGLLEAVRMGISVEDADAVMGKPVGIPKTAIFGLFDLIGIDLMPLIAKALLQTLPENDFFRGFYQEPDLIKKMISEGYTGRKGKGGFYRLNREDGKKQMEVIDFASGNYRPQKKSTLASVDAAKQGLRAMLEAGDIGSDYARRVLVLTLHYAASLIPEISDDLLSVDSAMKLGYNWKFGPFELLDRLGDEKESGAQWLVRQCELEKLDVPAWLRVAGKTLYNEDEQARNQWAITGGYTPIKVPEGAWLLKDNTRGKKPVAKNASCRLWDLGDGVAGLEFTSKMNSIDADILEMMSSLPDLVAKDFRGLVIGSDADQFSVGANLAFFMYVANLADWKMLSGVIRQGQQAYMGLKYANFPVVSALSGMALGGGCELALHSDAVQAHLESYPGLVEVGVGVIPAWGGCTEMLVRAGSDGRAGSGQMPAISKIFEMIATAKVAGSAIDAQEMGILNAKSRISMNRNRVLADAKELCLSLAPNYTPPAPAILQLPGAAGKAALQMAISGFMAAGKASEHDALVSEHLATILTGGNTDITEQLTEQDILNLEHDAFMDLVKTKKTLERIQYMLENNKPLRN